MKLNVEPPGADQAMIDSTSTFKIDERCRFRPIKGGGLRVVLRLTMRCDLACPHCLATGASDGVELTTGQWLELIEQFPEIDARKVLLTGGEPLLRNDLVSMVEALFRIGLASDLNSNLQKMTMTLMRDLKQAGLSEISISLEGSEEVHDRMHGCSGAYARLLQALEWANRFGVPVDASCCLTQENSSSVDELMETVGALPIRSLTFSRLLPIGHGKGALQGLSQARLDKCGALIQKKVQAGLSVPVRVTGLAGPPQLKDCGRGNSLLAMTADGRLLGCVLTDDNPSVPHPLEVGLRAAWDRLQQKLAHGKYALCWTEGD
jgi:MoaA/NifB/PqqE/SkfB family radical SAM enzyme